MKKHIQGTYKCLQHNRGFNDFETFTTHLNSMKHVNLGVGGFDAKEDDKIIWSLEGVIWARQKANER